MHRRRRSSSSSRRAAVGNDYFFFAGYTVLQFVVLATAWNILGGYTGYVNFGSAAFFALGAYTTVFLHKSIQLPLPVLIVIGAAVSGLVGLGIGYLTLRLRGVFFAIATLALAVVLQTSIVNWDYVGGSRGAYVIRPARAGACCICSYIQYLFLVMLRSRVISIVVARTIEHSTLGRGFAAIRDDELAAEASGVPTLRLKLIATTLSRRAHGHGRRAVSLLHHLPASPPRLQPLLRGEHHRDAADRRHDELVRAADRRGAARHGAAGGDGDDLVGGQSAHRRRAAGAVRHRRAERHHRPVSSLRQRCGEET